MPDAFFQAAFCQAPKIAGRQLLPFSLSHVMLLRGLGNGFATRGDGTRSELLTALLVCSRTHKQNARALFGQKQSILSLIAWAARWPDSRLEPERVAFQAYLSDYLTTPEHWEDGSASGGFLAPWPYHFVLTLTEHYGCYLDEAWDMPVGLARCYYDVWAETQGDKSLISEKEKRDIEAVNTL